MPLSENDPRVRLQKTAFVIYNHSDLDRAKTFLDDFGFRLIKSEHDGESLFYGGYGTEPFCYWARKSASEPSFGGACYAVESRDELDKASKIIGATPIRSFEGPGGGDWVSIKDPWGYFIHLIHGQAEKPATLPDFPSLVTNYEQDEDKPRRGEFVRMKTGPAPVHKWGHYGFTYPIGKHDEVFDWYTTNFALGVSDQLHTPEGQTIVTFFHIDRGLDYTDHCFFIKPAKPENDLSVAHSAFEVHDFDIQQLGHQHLEQKGYSLCWGVGRHILGSQVFDYWFDTSGFVVEHHCDGDLVNQETEVSKGLAGPHSLKIWGPPVPSVF